MPLAALDLGTVFILVVVIALPVGGLAFALGAGNALQQIGKGAFAIDQDMPQSSGGGGDATVSAEVREEEIRQMIQARSDRGVAKGRKPIDVDAEVEKLLASETDVPKLGGDQGLREEVRQLVVARNERRQRQGKKALDVEKEIDRQLRELENLGQ
jgi:hypothetical protein